MTEKEKCFKFWQKKLSPEERKLAIIATENYSLAVENGWVPWMPPYKFLSTGEWIQWIGGQGNG